MGGSYIRGPFPDVSLNSHSEENLLKDLMSY